MGAIINLGGSRFSKSLRFGGWILACLILLAACADLDPSENRVAETALGENERPTSPAVVQTDTPATHAPDPDLPVRNRRVATDVEYNRMADAGENGFPGVIPFDGILPIYEPMFVAANEAMFQDDELVMGVAIGDEAKAYPVTVLHFREMVNDELAGIPILVSW